MVGGTGGGMSVLPHPSALLALGDPMTHAHSHTLTCRCWGQQTAAWCVVAIHVSLGSVRWQKDGARGSPGLLI